MWISSKFPGNADAAGLMHSLRSAVPGEILYNLNMQNVRCRPAALTSLGILLEIWDPSPYRRPDESPLYGDS